MSGIHYWRRDVYISAVTPFEDTNEEVQQGNQATEQAVGDTGTGIQSTTGGAGVNSNVNDDVDTRTTCARSTNMTGANEAFSSELDERITEGSAVNNTNLGSANNTNVRGPPRRASNAGVTRRIRAAGN